MTVTLLGALLVATRADPGTLASFSFNVGDLWMLAACCLYAGYTVALRGRPAVPGLVFFAGLAGVALLTSVPLMTYEVATGTATWPTPHGWLIVLYVGLFPSFVSQVLFMRGVELIGPGRAVRQPGADLWRAACGPDPRRALCGLSRCGPDPSAWRYLAGRTEAGVKEMLPGAGSLVQGQNRSLLSEGSRRIWQRTITRVDFLGARGNRDAYPTRPGAAGEGYVRRRCAPAD